MDARRAEELDAIIVAEGLRPEAARAFVETALRDGAVPTSGTAIMSVLPPMSRFSAAVDHGAVKARVLATIAAFVERFSGLA